MADGPAGPRLHQQRIDALGQGRPVQQPVQCRPAAVASMAVARAVRSARSGSKLAASPSGIGNTVRMP
ncbi:MAG: hypothetical protein RR804_08635, partial [Massilia sp.]